MDGWSGSEISCQCKSFTAMLSVYCDIFFPVYDCGSAGITSPQNGSVDYNQTIFGSVAIFSCTDDHVLIGTPTRTCGIYGWSDENPMCCKNM